MRRELLLLREMRDAATAILDLVADRSAEQVEADTLRRSALLWHFTVLGEAASQVPAETKDSDPEIAWTAAARLRNRIVHGYWNSRRPPSDDRPARSRHRDALVSRLRPSLAVPQADSHR